MEEPIFTLRAQDVHAPEIIIAWVQKVTQNPVFEDQNSDALEKKEKPKEKSCAKKEKVQEHYFEQSPYYDRQKFLEYWTGDKYPISEFPNTDTSYYYNAVKDWAEYGSRKNPGKQTAKDWIGTARTFMRGDLKEGKLKLKAPKLTITQEDDAYTVKRFVA